MRSKAYLLVLIFALIPATSFADFSIPKDSQPAADFDINKLVGMYYGYSFNYDTSQKQACSVNIEVVAKNFLQVTFYNSVNKPNQKTLTVKYPQLLNTEEINDSAYTYSGKEALIKLYGPVKVYNIFKGLFSTTDTELSFSKTNNGYKLDIASITYSVNYMQKWDNSNYQTDYIRCIFK